MGVWELGYTSNNFIWHPYPLFVHYDKYENLLFFFFPVGSSIEIWPEFQG